MIFWDWNGTLLDDAEYSMNVMNRILTLRKLPVIPSLEAYRRVFCFPVTDYYRRVGVTEATLDEDGHRWMDLYVENEKVCPLRERAEEALRFVRAQNEKQMILSASTVPLLDLQTRERGVFSLLDGILALDNIWAAGKIEIGLKYMRENSLSPDLCCMIGDSLHDAEVAGALKCRCVLVRNGHQNDETIRKAGVPITDNVFEAAELALKLIRS